MKASLQRFFDRPVLCKLFLAISLVVNIPPLIIGNGFYNLGLTTTSGTAFRLASRESSANAPQFIIEMVR